MNLCTQISEFGFTKTASAIVCLWENGHITRSQAVVAFAALQEEHNNLRPYSARVYALDTCAKVYGKL